MVGLAEGLLGVVLAVVLLWALHRLSVIGKAAVTLWRTSTDTVVQFADGQQIALEGQVVVDEPAGVAERLFDPTDGPVGVYVWRAWTPDTGRNIYDFDRGELRGGRSTFASGIESGTVGINTDGQQVTIEFDWLRDAYDTDTLSDLEVGNPMSDASLPTFLTRYLWDSNYIALKSTIGDSPVNKLRDIVTVDGDSGNTSEFNIEARGITSGSQLFIVGELREQDGTYVLGGTAQTPLLLSDTGREGLSKQLRWRTVKYSIALSGASALLAVFVF